MDQVHKRFTAEQVRVLLKGYCQGTLDRLAVEETLGIGKTRFFALLRQYRRGMGEFSLAYQRATPTRLPASAEKQIEAELMLEKGLIEDPSLPISNYNYAAIRDRLAARRVAVSSPTIIVYIHNFQISLHLATLFIRVLIGVRLAFVAISVHRSSSCRQKALRTAELAIDMSIAFTSVLGKLHCSICHISAITRLKRESLSS